MSAVCPPLPLLKMMLAVATPVNVVVNHSVPLAVVVTSVISVPGHVPLMGVPSASHA